MSHIVWFKGNNKRQINVQTCKDDPCNQIYAEKISSPINKKKIKTRCVKVKKMFLIFFIYKNGEYINVL